MSWKPRKISGKQKRVEGRTVHCYNRHNEGRRPDKNHVKEGTKFYCIGFGHDDFSLNVEEGKKAPKLRMAHGNHV